MEIPDSMTIDAIKKSVGYNYYMAKKKESAKDKIIDEPEEKHVSPVKNRRGKGFICYRDHVVIVPTSLKRDVVPSKTRSVTIVEETDMYNEWGGGQKTHKGSKASRLESLRQKKQLVIGEGSNTIKESANETDDFDESDIDLSDDNPNKDDDAARYGVFMHNKSIATPNSTYLSPTVTSSSLGYIQTLLDEINANELTDFMSHPVYTDTQITLVVHNPEGNPELTSYILVHRVPRVTHVDVSSNLKNFIARKCSRRDSSSFIILLQQRTSYTAIDSSNQSSPLKPSKEVMQGEKEYEGRSTSRQA
ncbi:hypothetical protein Tco_1361713 [Tanacetum coccineum]